MPDSLIIWVWPKLRQARASGFLLVFVYNAFESIYFLFAFEFT